jgi:predicted deacylase
VPQCSTLLQSNRTADQTALVVSYGSATERTYVTAKWASIRPTIIHAKRTAKSATQQGSLLPANRASFWPADAGPYHSANEPAESETIRSADSAAAKQADWAADMHSDLATKRGAEFVAQRVSFCTAKKFAKCTAICGAIQRPQRAASGFAYNAANSVAKLIA